MAHLTGDGLKGALIALTLADDPLLATGQSVNIPQIQIDQASLPTAYEMEVTNRRLKQVEGRNLTGSPPTWAPTLSPKSKADATAFPLDAGAAAFGIKAGQPVVDEFDEFGGGETFGSLVAEIPKVHLSETDIERRRWVDRPQRLEDRALPLLHIKGHIQKITVLFW